jgi:hypothetical protein
MTIANIVAELDAEITRLEQVKALLSNGQGSRATGVASGNVVASRRKRTLSAEARKKIAEAQRKRWAKQKKAKQ